MGAVALFTAAAARRRGQPARTPVLYGILALLAGGALLGLGR